MKLETVTFEGIKKKIGIEMSQLCDRCLLEMMIDEDIKIKNLDMSSESST